MAIEPSDTTRSSRPVDQSPGAAAVDGSHRTTRTIEPSARSETTPPTGAGDGSWARETAGRLLEETSARHAHTRRVARQAATVSHLLDEPWRSAIGEAAWLHDIGYSPALVDTGFHPLDGARWLRARGRSDEVCSLVAWHTRARTEARLRGLEDALVAEFAAPPATAQATLTWADLTSSPNGERCSPATRISDILHRYGPESIVHQATLANEAELLDDARSVADRMTEPAGDPA